MSGWRVAVFLTVVAAATAAAAEPGLPATTTQAAVAATVPARGAASAQAAPATPNRGPAAGEARRAAPTKARTAKGPEAPVAPGTEAIVETVKGSFTIRLLPEVAPRHAALFVRTAKAGGYDGTTFHRVIAGGIIQGGDPLTKDEARSAAYGTGGLGLLRAEISDRPFVRGTVAAVRRPSSPDTSGVQFFVVMREQPSMKGQYTIFGEVVSGMEVVDQISTVPVNGDRAQERVEMKVSVREKSAE